MLSKLVSADSLQRVIGVGCNDVSMQQEEFFIPEQCKPLRRKNPKTQKNKNPKEKKGKKKKKKKKKYPPPS